MQKKTESMRIVLTGGHAATTALAVVEEIIRRHGTSWTIYWIGAKAAFEGKKIPSLESTVLPTKGVIFRSIFTGKLHKRFSRNTIPSISKIPLGFIHAYYLLRRIKPSIVLSFGGFAAFPVVVVAWILRIPVIAHEQTSAVGRANKFSSFFATKIALSRQSSAKFFPKSKVVITGNPLMSQIWEVPPKAKPTKPSTIFITGGSRGSQNLNNLIRPILPSLISKYVVIHQTGALDYEKYLKIKNNLKTELTEKYEVYPFIDPMQMDGVYKRADIIIARAGANTVSETIAIKRPSIFIPIPWVTHHEQRENALFAQNFGSGFVLEQEAVKSDEIENLIEKIFNDWDKIYSKIKDKKSPDYLAQARLVDIIEGCLN